MQENGLFFFSVSIIFACSNLSGPKRQRPKQQRPKYWPTRRSDLMQVSRLVLLLDDIMTFLFFFPSLSIHLFATTTIADNVRAETFRKIFVGLKYMQMLTREKHSAVFFASSPENPPSVRPSCRNFGTVAGWCATSSAKPRVPTERCSISHRMAIAFFFLLFFFL